MPAIPALLAASLLSAASSLPMHLLPLLVVALAAQAQLGAAQAAWIASACMLGQLLMALALPGAGARRLSRNAAAAAVAVVLAGLLLSEELASRHLWLGWLAIGAACGALQFLGASTAAAFPARQTAFALRLSITLLVGGLVIGGLQLAGALRGYAQLVLGLSVLFALLAGLGLTFYRAPVAQPLETERGSAGTAQPIRLAGLAVIFLLFVGQPGFWAFALEGIRQRGVVLDDVAIAMAVCKIVAAAALLAMAARKPCGSRPVHLAWPGIGAAAGIAGMALASGAPQFFAAMLLWELGLNVLSARLQAAVVQDSPAASGAWLSGAALLGAATGPVLHAAAIQGGVPMVFVAYACASALLPFAWAWRSTRGSRAATRAAPGLMR